MSVLTKTNSASVLWEIRPTSAMDLHSFLGAVDLAPVNDVFKFGIAPPSDKRATMSISAYSRQNNHFSHLDPPSLPPEIRQLEFLRSIRAVFSSLNPSLG